MPSNYETPEMYGTVGDGITDDSDAFEQCMNSSTQNILLTGDYLIKKNIYIMERYCVKV